CVEVTEVMLEDLPNVAHGFAPFTRAGPATCERATTEVRGEEPSNARAPIERRRMASSGMADRARCEERTMTRHLAYRSSARLSIERLREDTPAACERGRNAAGRRQGGARSTDPRVPSSTGAGPARARNRPSRCGAQSDVDPWEDRPSDFPAGAEREARRLAATTGAN